MIEVKVREHDDVDVFMRQRETLEVLQQDVVRLLDTLSRLEVR